MEVQFGPNSVDEPNLLYGLQRKIKVFNTNNQLPNQGYNLVATSSKYGIVFIASPNGVLSVYNLRDLINKEHEPQHFPVKLQVQPTHIAVNCDQEWLAVVGSQALLVYKCVDFQNQNVGPSATIKCEVNPATFVSSLQWNPCMPDTIGIVYFDGSLIVSQISTMQVKKIQSNARCLCWSPKGKQLVTGNNDGTLSQYKPDLSPMKMIPAPNLFEGAPVEALAIYWISTYQFAVAFKNPTDNSRPAVTIVNTPKAAQASCVNYEDICYSMGGNRPWYYYLQGLAPWNMIFSSSSNSMELATLASADGSNWLQWCQSDEARPELPLTDKKKENYPVGISIDTCAIHQLPWGENETLPPMPILHVVSHTGMLSIFNIINLNKSAGQLCTPPQPFALPNAALTSEIPNDVPPQSAEQPQEKPQQQTVQPQPFMPQPVQPQPVPPQPVQPQSFMPQPVQPQTFVPQPVQAQFQPQSMQQLVTPQPVQSQEFVPHSVQSQPFQSQSSLAQQLQATSKSTLLAQPNNNVEYTTAITVSFPKKEASPQTFDKNNLDTVPPTIPSVETTAAMKSEQKKANKAKLNQELKSMLLKEVNDFNLELYKFKKITYEKLIKIQRDIQMVNAKFKMHSLEKDQVTKACDADDIRESIVQLKLELVRACAVVAEARANAESKNYEWTQADPLTLKRIASIKKLAYYVQTQLDQARRALDHKWDELDLRERYRNPGQRMIRPKLDDVYQPLVRQQEILARQQAVLKTLKNTVSQCDSTPLSRSTSLLRHTPFRNRDPLSKLTKNILNMSVEPPTVEPFQYLSCHKLDALRDMLSNHKPIKVKPIPVDLRQHVESLRVKYEKSVKEKEEMKETDENRPPNTNDTQTQTMDTSLPIKPEPELENLNLLKGCPINIPSFTPVNNMKPVQAMPPVARMLFTDEPKQEQLPPREIIDAPTIRSLLTEKPKPVVLQQNVTADQKKPSAQPIATVIDSSNTRQVLQSLLKGESPTPKDSDNNIFMGQKICSPSVFTFSKSPLTSTPPSAFAPKPNNQTNLSIFSTSANIQKSDSKITPNKPNSQETGGREAGTVKQLVEKPAEVKPVTIFGSNTQQPKIGNVPDVLKSGEGFVFGKAENNNTTKQVVKESEKSKENVPETAKDSVVDKKGNDTKLPISSNKTADVTSTAIKDLKPQVFGSSEAKTNASPSESSLLKPSPITTKPPSNLIPKIETIKKEPDTSSASVSTSSLQASLNAASSTSSLTSNASAGSKSSESSATASTGQSSAFVAISQQPIEDSKPIVLSTPTPTTTSATTSAFASHTSFVTQSSAFATNASTIFASASASTFGAQTTQSLFGSTTTTTTAQSVFGQTTTSSPAFTTASAQSIFSAAASNVFGDTSPTTTTSQSIFGSPPSTTSQSIFSSSPSTSPSIFGTGPVFGKTQASIFGSPTATTQASVFGSPTTLTPSVFGSSPSGAVFGSPTTQSGSLFGAPATTAQTGSLFGTPTTTQSGSLFGSAEANLFAAASISTTSAPTSTSGGNIFGGGSVFGGNTTNVFGNKAGFGGAQAQSANNNIFGGGTTFGQKPATDFWGGSNASDNSSFGSTGFGQQTTQAQSIFGGSGGSFTASATGQPFGSPQGVFSGGDAKTVFGTPQQQTGGTFGGSPGSFGSKPVFGGSPGFGGSGFGGFNKSPSSGFGASPSFGGGATFGASSFGSTSPGKVFGGSPSPSFGTPTQSNATFENLATQNTLTFGNLAQQSGQPAQAAPPSFNTSPSFTGWRG